MDEYAGRELSRRTFFKVGAAGLLSSFLVFAAGCAGEGEDEEDGNGGEEEDD